MSLNETVALFQQFKAAAEAPVLDTALTASLLTQVKLRVIPATANPSSVPVAELALAREALETALLLAVRTRDVPSFERTYIQLRPFYLGAARSLLPPSQRERLVLGLNLTRLLSQNAVSAFHTELELIPDDVRATDRFLRFPVELERFMMEGSYNKVLNARKEMPAECFGAFVDTLSVAVRTEIADCTEAAYESLSVDAARKSLMFPDGAAGEAEFAKYAAERGWCIGANGRVTFPAASKGATAAAAEIPAHKLIHDSLSYARELERII